MPAVHVSPARVVACGCLFLLSVTALLTSTSSVASSSQQGSLYFDGNAYGQAVDDLFSGGYQWPFTMEAWVKTTNHTQNKGAILNKEGFWTEIRLFYTGETPGGDLRSFYATDNPSQHYEGPGPGPGGPLPNNAWTHVALVGEGSSLRMYKGGVLVAENTNVIGPPYWGSNPPSADRLKVGKMIFGGSPFYFYGCISEVRVSNVARYSGDFTPSTLFSGDPNTELLLHFNEGSGNVANDSSGHGHHFDLTNTQWSTPDCSTPLADGPSPVPSTPAPTTPVPTTPMATTPAPITPGATSPLAVGGIVEMSAGGDSPSVGLWRLVCCLLPIALLAGYLCARGRPMQRRE